MLNHFNFKRIENDKILITNDFGRYAFVNTNDFKALLNDSVEKGTPLYNTLKKKLFLLSPMELYSDEVIYSLRSMKNYVFRSTELHIFVVTNMCNLNCVYCQAQDKNAIHKGNMSIETGKKAIDIALQSPAKSLTFEFQGGEPLMNFPVIKQMVEYAEEVCGDKHIDFTLVSNLSLLTSEILDFLIQHHVNICTSMDGPEELHNKNRRCLDGRNSYQLMKAGTNLMKERGLSVSAIETTTRASLGKAKEIVHAYYEMGTPGLFIRPLTPLGFAKSEWEEIGYTPDEFIEFYKEAFYEVLEINKSGVRFVEQHATYFLEKILHGYSPNYMELRSPCGAAVGQLAYYYNGDIYTCDEARMVAEAGDDAFKLGNVYTSDYQQLMSSGTCKATCIASIMESIPGCCDCVYHPYCGVCPVVNYASTGDIFSKQNNNYRCLIYKGILDFLFELLYNEQEDIMKILYSWVGDDKNEIYKKEL